MPRNRIVYKCKVFKVGVKRLAFPEGKLDYSTIIVGDTAAVVPILDDGRILLESIYRNTIDKWLYELPAGHVDKGESPQTCAARELAEETGYTARSVKPLFAAPTSSGISNEILHVFVATGLTKGKANREISEQIRLRPMTLSKALKIAKSNKGMDMKTIAGLLFYSKYIAK